MDGSMDRKSFLMVDSQLYATNDEISVKKPQRAKPSARHILEALSEKRLLTTDLVFLGTDQCDDVSGGHADVQAAVVARSGKVDGRRRPKNVAVKKLRYLPKEDANVAVEEERFLRLFTNEVHILSSLSHPNIIRLVGFVEDISTATAWLVLPWESNGNLRVFLQAGTWDIPERVFLIQEAALGIEYLHTLDLPVCHGDLKSLNVLVTARHSVAITDFGTARVLRDDYRTRSNYAGELVASMPNRSAGDPSGSVFNVDTSASHLTLTGPVGSVRWTPPEVLNGAVPDLSSDIWALGWIAWEAITDCFPFQDVVREDQVVVKLAMQQVLPQVHDHHRLSQIRILCDLMVKCWSLDPSARPSAEVCKVELEKMPRAIPGVKISDFRFKHRSAALLIQNGEVLKAAGKYHDALKTFREAEAICLATEDDVLEAEALTAQGEIHLAGGDRTNAEQCILRSLEICRSIKDWLGEAKALKDLGDLRQTMLQYDEAEELYTEAFLIYTRNKHRPGQAGSLKGLGDIQLRQQGYLEAEKSYVRALDVYREINNRTEEARVLKDLGTLYIKQSRWTDAEQRGTEALDLHAEIGDRFWRARSLKKLGSPHLAQSWFNKAEESFAQAWYILGETDDSIEKAKAYEDLGRTWISHWRYDDAENSYSQALKTYTRIGADWGTESVLKCISNLYSCDRNILG